MSHLFKSRSGMTINQYVNALRIDEARAMLDSTDMSIQDIGLTVGFSDANYFSNVFRASVGVSPREYRNRFRKSDNGKDPE
ncbi:MAG: helix-turn-helix transcriptional regulator [Eubacteriales bacterium]|nr:helix-turn-helix transcriptional regulator [Eubacteriales bacterium]